MSSKELKDYGYFLLRDAGSSFYDRTQGVSLGGKTPAYLKLTPLVRRAIASKYIIEITESKFNTILKELGLELNVKSGKVEVTLEALTKNQQELLNSALKLEVIIKRNKAFYLEKERIASGPGGLVKVMKDRKFVAKLKQLLAAVEDVSEITEDVKPVKADNSEYSDLLLEAISAELIQQDNGIYLYGDTAIGVSDEEAIEFLSSEENKEVVDKLKKELEKGE